jgi:hypothetical protein
MAGHAVDHDHADYTPGSMEIDEQRSTFHIFIGLVKWGSLFTSALLLMLSIWFGTEAGPLTAIFTAVVVLVLGWWLLRDKRRDVH